MSRRHNAVTHFTALFEFFVGVPEVRDVVADANLLAERTEPEASITLA